MKKPGNDLERRITADRNCDLGMALANALAQVDRDGLTVHDRMRAARAGQLGAGDYDRPNVKTSTMSDPTATTGMHLEEFGDEAAKDLEDHDDDLHALHVILERATDRVAKYMARPPMRKEAILTALEEGSRDPGCESCGRVTKGDGTKANEKTRATTNCCTAVPSGPVDQNTARLDKRYRLCRWCEDYVLAVVAQGAKAQLHDAIPLRTARAHVNGERVFKPYKEAS